MNLFILICSMLFQNTIKNTTYSPYSTMESAGNDGRFTNLYPFMHRWENENEILYKIQQYNHYMALLKFLESSNNSEKDKIERIEFESNDPSYKIYDLYAGGLMTEWDAEDWNM